MPPKEKFARIERDKRVKETAVDSLFDAAFLGRLESLSLLARQIRRGSQRAERKSTLRGASVEFAEYRPFTEGDDWRYIDWNAYARWRQLVLKLFVEEEDLHVHLLVDCSASMNWGRPDKFDHARRVAAGLAYMALANLDRVSISPFGGRADAALWPSSRGKHRFLGILRYLASCQIAEVGVRLEDAARKWTASRPRRGLVIWLGDLWGADEEDAFRALDRLRHARHEVAVLQITDPTEADAGAPGEYELEDCETGEIRRVLVSPAMAREYRRRVTAYQEAIRSYARRHQIALLSTDTTMDPADLLQRALHAGGFVR